MKVDRDVEAFPGQPPAKRDVMRQPAHTWQTRRDDDVGEVRVADDHRSTGRFDDIGELCRGKTSGESRKRRRREDDVADLPESDQEDLQSFDLTVTARWWPRRST